MTAAKTAKAIGIGIKIDYLLGESMYDWLFKENPLNPSKLWIHTKSKKEIIQNYLDGVNFEDAT